MTGVSIPLMSILVLDIVCPVISFVLNQDNELNMVRLLVDVYVLFILSISLCCLLISFHRACVLIYIGTCVD